MSKTVYPCFSIGVIYAEDRETTNNIIRDCINQLRSQGFRIHDFGTPECLEDYLAWIDDSDVIVVFCNSDLVRYGDQFFITERPFVQEKLQKKICIPVLIQGNEETSVPEWANGTILDCRDDDPLSEFNLRHMEIPLGNVLRRIEFRMMDDMVSEAERGNVCLDCVSVNRRKELQRFILHNRHEETFVRALFALGRSLAIIQPFPEWIVYEDPVFFTPDNDKNVVLQLAHVGERDLNPLSKNYGAYCLDKPIGFKVPEKMLYHDHQKLVEIACNLLEQPGESDFGYLEASLSDLYLMDMEFNVPIPDEEVINRYNLIWMDQKAMERAIGLWSGHEEIPDC